VQSWPAWIESFICWFHSLNIFVIFQSIREQHFDH
jgi:hypothetical protein